jgi:hypothetical protein
MLVVVHFLQAWGHRLLGKLFIVKKNHVAINYFATQPKLSPKQAWWKYFLVETDMTIKYQLGKLNTIEDTLCKKL